MKKCLSKLIASVVMGTLIVMPVQAAPDTESIQTEIDSSQNEVNGLQTQLRSVLNRIYTLENQMITTGEKIIQATSDLESAEELEQQQYEDMKLRIKYLYEEDSNNTLEKLLTSGSFSELLNQAEYIQSMYSYDREMLNEYVATKDKVAELKSTLETEMAELESMQTEFSDQQASLNSTIANKQSEVSDLDDQLQTAAQATAEEIQVAENTEVQSQDTELQSRDTEEQSQVEETQVASAEDIADISNINNNTDNMTDDTDDNTSNNETEPAAASEITVAVEGNEMQSPVDETKEDAAKDNTNNSNNNSDNTANDTSNTTNSDTDSNTNNASSSDSNSTNSNSNTDNAASDTTSNTGSDTASNSNTTAAQKIVSAAYTQLGVKYVWGGTTPYVGLDCSGLTQYAHKQAGISIGRTSAVQGAGGKAVTTPQAGDLVCYAGHVGIYIGNGEMIHAPYTGSVVKVQSVYGSPWYRRYW